MKTIIRGNAVVLKMDDVSTDHIYPAKYINLSDPAQMAKHVLEGADKTIKERLKTVGNILVTGSNFACGSSREQAVITLKQAGVRAVIANTAARIWFRNAINLALPVILCPGFVDQVIEGEELEIDLKSGRIRNETQETDHQGQALTDFILSVFTHGGIKPMMREKQVAIQKSSELNNHSLAIQGRLQ